MGKYYDFIETLTVIILLVTSVVVTAASVKYLFFGG